MLIRSIEKFLKYHGMPPTKFGRLAAHDPRFVLDLRNGRIPREETAARVERFMRGYRSADALGASPHQSGSNLPEHRHG